MDDFNDGPAKPERELNSVQITIARDSEYGVSDDDSRHALFVAIVIGLSVHPAFEKTGHGEGTDSEDLSAVLIYVMPQ